MVVLYFILYKYLIFIYLKETYNFSARLFHVSKIHVFLSNLPLSHIHDLRFQMIWYGFVHLATLPSSVHAFVALVADNVHRSPPAHPQLPFQPGT